MAAIGSPSPSFKLSLPSPTGPPPLREGASGSSWGSRPQTPSSRPQTPGRAASIPRDVSKRAFALAASGDCQGMLELLELHPELWKLRDVEFRQPLHIAAQAGHLPMLQVLTTAGATPHVHDCEGWEPLHFACAYGHAGVAEWLIRSGASSEALSTSGWQPIHCAVDAGHAQVARFLHARGAPIDTVTTSGHDLLHLAADKGHFELVKWLVRTRDGANVRVQDIVGWEPLHFAARGGHLQIFRWLTTQQYTHVDLCCAAVGGWQPIHVAVFGGHVDVARWLTVQQEVKPLAGVLQARADLGWTPLHAAAFAGALSTTIWLADNGVDVNAKAEDGSTPLSLAEQFAHKQVLTRLKSFGALDQGAPSEPSTRPNELLMMTIPRRNLQYSRAAPLKDESKGMAAAIASAVRDAFFSPAPQAEPPSAEEAASIVLQSAWRGVQAVRVLTAKRFLVRLMALTVNVEHRKARVIQASYREYTSKLRQLALLSKSEQLALVLKGQAARQVRGALDKLHMATELKAELRILMEKGRVYPLTNGGELVSWGVRYAYVGESGGRSGLCYQHVDTRTMVPYGKVKGIAWDTIAKVEVLLDNTVCIESTAGVKHNFRPVRCRDPPTVAWFWALRLCQLAELLGFRYDGFVADAARDENEKLTRPEPWVAALQDTGATGEQRRGAAGGAQALDEYADVAVEAERRRQWIRYFVKKGNYQKAKEIGWDGADPPDPRKAERPAVAPAARAPKDERAPLLPGSVSGAQIKVDAPAAPEPAGAKADRIAAEGAENKEPVQTPPAIVTRI